MVLEAALGYRLTWKGMYGRRALCCITAEQENRVDLSPAPASKTRAAAHLPSAASDTVKEQPVHKVPLHSVLPSFRFPNISDLKRKPWTMSGLVSKTRLSWALVVVVKEGQRSLHLIKKNYRGKISYFSKSARGVQDKVGFGEVRKLLFIFTHPVYVNTAKEK